MRIRKILMYLIFAFVMVMPFSVSAEDLEYDIKLDSSYIQIDDISLFDKIKLNGYNAVIKTDRYLSTHSTVETYNEFYLNNGYFIAIGPDGEYGIYYDFSGNDYIYGSTAIMTVDIAGGHKFNNRLLVGFYYDSWYSFNNVLEPTLKETSGFYSMVDKNINNTDMLYEYEKSDYLSTNTSLPNFKYTILSTNRSFKWVSVTDSVRYVPEGSTMSVNGTYSYFIKRFIKKYLNVSYENNTYVSDIIIKSFNSKSGNVFRHPYSTEETNKQESDISSTIFSINSSNYSSFKINYNILKTLNKSWWDKLWDFGYNYADERKDSIKIFVSATSPISYPRRYSNYVKGSSLELIKEPNDFGDTVLSTEFTAYISDLGGQDGVKNGYFYFDLRGLPENTIITVRIYYYDDFVEFEPIELPETNFVEYDLTGKYAVGLVPKFIYSNNKFSLLYQGNFTTYYAFNSNTYNVYDSEIIKSLDTYSKKIISFSNFKDTTVYEKPIFYIMNNLYTDDAQVSKIKYNPDYFELLVYNTIEDVVISEYTGHSYSSPSQNYNSSGSGINDSNNSSESNSILDFGNLFTNLPDFIVGLGSAFTALGTCIMIAFSSLPEMVQSVLWFCLLVSAIVLVIKLLK